MVDKAEDVLISEVMGERTIVFEIRVGSGDIGNIIGKRGRAVRSIQTLLSAVSAWQKNKKPLLEVLKQPRTYLQQKNMN